MGVAEYWAKIGQEMQMRRHVWKLSESEKQKRKDSKKRPELESK